MIRLTVDTSTTEDSTMRQTRKANTEKNSITATEESVSNIEVDIWFRDERSLRSFTTLCRSYWWSFWFRSSEPYISTASPTEELPSVPWDRNSFGVRRLPFQMNPRVLYVLLTITLKSISFSERLISIKPVQRYSVLIGLTCRPSTYAKSFIESCERQRLELEKLFRGYVRTWQRRMVLLHL